MLYILLAMSIVCEDYFVASLTAIGIRFQLSDDVNGATLMAAGSSMPEVFSSLMALLSTTTDNSLGMATVSGSSVYNILVIIGWSAIAGKDIMLDWKPLVRDSVFYFITIIFLIGTFAAKTSDFPPSDPLGECTGCITLRFWNGAIAVLLYSFYVFFMTRNQRAYALMDALAEKHSPFLHRKTTERLRIKAAAEGRRGGGGVEAPPEEGAELEPLHGGEGQAGGKEEHEEAHEEDHLVWPAGGTAVEKAKFVVKAPTFFLLCYTVPDCRSERWRQYYWITFVTSIFWIALLAKFLVDWASSVACVLHVPDIIVGLTVLAAGTSLPDTLSSVIVARKGLGDMAVANAIGSNVFNVLFGLGMPWCLYTLFSAEGRKTGIRVPTAGLAANSVIMGVVGIFYLATFTLRGFHMTARLGQVFIGLYAAYVIGVIATYSGRPPSATCVA